MTEIIIAAADQTEGCHYRLERAAFTSAWVLAGAVISFQADPEDGLALRTGVDYLITEEVISEGEESRIYCVAHLSDDGVVSIDPAGELDPRYYGDGTPALWQKPDLDYVARNGNITDLPIRVGGIGRTAFTETDVFKGIAVIVETSDGASQFIEMTDAEYLALVMGGLIPTPTLDEVALAGNVTGRPLLTGGIGRPDFTNILSPYGIAAIYDAGPGAKFIEMIQKVPLQAWLDVIPVAAEGRASGKVPVLRVKPDGSYEFALADRDTFRDVTRRSNVTDVPILTTGYGRPGITKVPTALTFACWVPNATQTEHYIEGIGVREAIAWLLQHADAQQLFDILLPLLRPGDGAEQQYIVDGFRCMDAPILAPPTRYTVNVSGAMNGQSFPHPYMDTTKVFPTVWQSETTESGTTNVPMSSVTPAIHPQSLTLTIPADLEPFTGKINLDYVP